MTEYGRALRHLFALEEDMVFLNHGAYGATPRELFDRQNEWRLRMEAQPPRFFMNELPDLIREASASLAGFVGAAPERTVLLENATSGMNAVLRSLRFAPGDRIVTTDHVYGAVRNTLRFVAESSGAEVVEVPVPMPLRDPSEVTDALERALDDRTRLVVVDHIASPSALVFRIADIVRRCRTPWRSGARRRRPCPRSRRSRRRRHRVPTGTSATPTSGCARRRVRRSCVRARMRSRSIRRSSRTPIARGSPPNSARSGRGTPPRGSAFRRRSSCTGASGEVWLRERNASLARVAGIELAAALGTELGGPASGFAAMVTVRLPCNLDATWENAGRIRDRLWQGHRVEALATAVAGRLWLRLSVFAYNDEADFETLPEAVRSTLAAESPRAVVPPSGPEAPSASPDSAPGAGAPSSAPGPGARAEGRARGRAGAGAA